MPVYHRTQRLQIFGEKPEIQKLYGSRYRMVVRCVAKNDTKAWYDDNKAQIFADFGSLYSAQMSVDGIDARTGEAYDDMVLVKNEATYTRSGEYVIVFTYETLTDSFVQETEDKVDFDLNGLKRLTRTIIAKDTVAYSSVVGTSTTGTSPVLTLAQISEDQLEASEDGFKRIQEVWLESGTLSETIDNVGSQKAKVIETIGADPATPTGYSLASKQESDFEGFQTNRFTFLKDNVILSESEDEVGSQNSIVQEVFNGTPATPSGYSLANKQESDVDGIPTKRYTFLKDNVILSESKDKVGSQSAIVQEVFNGTPATPSGYSIASEQKSDVDGIPTERFTFLENDVQLSQSEDKVGSQLAISQQWFNPDADKTLAGYSLASKNTSDFEGIKTVEFRFLKDDVMLSESEDEVGSQNAITEQWFKPSASRDTKASYSLARKEESDVGGIPTERYTFLKENVELSRSEDKVGSQLAITTEIFKPSSDPTESGYSVARTEVSDVEGIPTKRFTFLKENVVLSVSEDEVGSQNAIVEEWFKPSASRDTKANYSLARKEESDVGGIPTERYTFLKDNVVLSVSEDKVGSQKAIVNEVFNPASEAITGIDTSGTALSGYSEANRTESDYEGIKTIRVQFLKNNVVLSRSIQTKSRGKLILEVVEVFNGTPVAETTGAVKIGDEVSDVDGIPTRRFTFAKGDGQISVESKPAPVQLAGCTYVTVRSLGTEVTPTGVLVAESETESDGYITYEKTAIQGTITGTKQTYKDVVGVDVPGTVTCTFVSVSSGGSSGSVAVPQVTPRRSKQVSATVTVAIVTTPTNTATLAYNLGDISCSVTSTQASERIGPGATVFVGSETNNQSSTGYVKSFSTSARIQTYPGCYLQSSSSTGSVSYTAVSTPVANDNVISFVDTNSSTISRCTGTGSTSASGYQTTGVLKRSSRPILTTLDGTTYYEEITWSV